MPLANLTVALHIPAEPTPAPNTLGVRKTVTLHGPLDTTAQRLLRRVLAYCPVGQLLTQGALEIDDAVYAPGTPMVIPHRVDDAHTLPAPSWGLVPGEVSGHYLLETQTSDAEGVLHHEGEVKLYLTCANATRPGRWTLLAGHSADGWVPSPVPLTYAALAASTVATLQQTVPPDAWPPGGFQVDLAPYPGGNRAQSQASAAAGTRNARHLVRTVVVHGEVSTRLHQHITAALAQDPLTILCRTGAQLLGDEMVVV